MAFPVPPTKDVFARIGLAAAGKANLRRCCRFSKEILRNRSISFRADGGVGRGESARIMAGNREDNVI
jgi:hypothetical protein